jgi:hypothetical protein
MSKSYSICVLLLWSVGLSRRFLARGYEANDEPRLQRLIIVSVRSSSLVVFNPSIE